MDIRKLTPAANRKIAAITICAAVLLFACRKELKIIAQSGDTANKAFVKVVHASPSFRILFNTRDTFNVYFNNQKFNAAALTYGSAYPTTTGNGYAAVDPGILNITFFLAGVVKPDSVQLYSLTKTVEAGKYYSLLITDSVKSARDSSQIALIDNIVTPPQNLYGLRFVHALMNDTAGKKVDIWSARRNGNIFTGYGPGQSSTFTTFPFNAQVPDTLIVRRAGTLIELARLNNITFGHQRIYTMYYRGLTDSLSTAKRASRTLTYYVNK